ncbi:MAG: hypothetical protein K9J16_09850 [Melioribacteraceae bacterium]|nr:hypothetical protein [Melioribacteraceae bacterium]MCF8356802.1 hypothetical protein [Melioribacteraceae bacterium]MCF8394981.1 hypothetical protein [Melioribacteraceae bacterium]MCF8419701.1 hypothetical protein [Melioribacteraceae bacterium]
MINLPEVGNKFPTGLGRTEIIELLGKGKSGYSYLVDIASKKYVLKIMHDEPVPYYNFSGNKTNLEVNAYHFLKSIGIKIPNLLFHDIEKNYLVKEYIPGVTGTEWVIEGNFDEKVIEKLFGIAHQCKVNGIHLDYFPANFVINNNEMYYIDYEFNSYEEKWNLENWGIYYWANEEGFRKFLETGDASFINQDLANGIPIKEPFEKIVNEWITKYS